jgi:hypothetical protein
MELIAGLFFIGIAVLPAIFTAGAGAVLRPWLAAPTRGDAWRPIAAALLLLAVCGLMFVYGPSYPLVIIPALIWIGASIGAAVSVWRWRHLGRLRLIVAGAFMAIGFPALVLWIPDLSRAERGAEYDACAGPLVVDAVERYRTVVGRYPSAFNDLYREYPPLQQLRPPGPTFAPLLNAGGVRPGVDCYTTTTRWLYTTTGDQYALGYWRRYPGLEPLGARVCLYRSDARFWRCDWNGWGPFPAADSRRDD